MAEYGNQQDDLRRRLEDGFFLQNAPGGAFDLLEHRHEWRTAIILDACRFDTFEKVWGRNVDIKKGQTTNYGGKKGKKGQTPFSNSEKGVSPFFPSPFFAGRLERRISVASCTEDWVCRCLDRPLDDVVYISASPYVSNWYLEQLGVANRLAHLEEVWRDGWDDQLHTVPPGAVLAAHLRLRGRFADKKFVLHFMQPHHPYIGPVRIAGAGWRKYFGAMELDSPELDGKTPIEMLEDGQVAPEQVRLAYESNLELVLGHIQAAMADLAGPVVITADHGEAFGEGGIYGHPCGTLLPELIAVPYLVVD